MTEDLIARLTALEERVAQFAPPAMQRRPFQHHPAAWIKVRVLARHDEQQAASPMSFPEHARVDIIGEIDDAMARFVTVQIDGAAFARHLEIYIDTPGGNYPDALRIYRAIAWRNAQTKTARLGKRCQSAGPILMMACERRIARADTNLLLHGVGDHPDDGDHWSIRRHLQSILQRGERIIPRGAKAQPMKVNVYNTASNKVETQVKQSPGKPLEVIVREIVAAGINEHGTPLNRAVRTQATGSTRTPPGLLRKV